MKHLRLYEDDDTKGLYKDLKNIGFEKPLPPDNITADDFFEETMDHPKYGDVYGPSVEAALMDVMSEFEERIAELPHQHRKVAKQAIREYWIDKLKRDFI